MKYLIVIEDGASDYPIDSLEGKTPLKVANKPALDRIAREGKCGLIQNVPSTLPPGSDVANMSIFGYDPLEYYTGRGPLEAASMGVKVNDGDVIFRCNTITEKDGDIVSSNAGHITSEEAKILIEDLDDYFHEKYPDFKGKFYPGISYRHLFVYNDSDLTNLDTIGVVPPHDIVGENIKENLFIDEDFDSDSPEVELIKKISYESQEFLENHPVNQKRAEEGKEIANMVWLWGQGTMPAMPSLKETYNLNGAVITGVDLINGLGVCSESDIIEVPGATGFFDTDYKAKGEYAIEALKNHDVLFIHVEAPDEAGHAGEIEEKIKAIESIDKYIIAPVFEYLESQGDFKVAVLPDHPTPIDVRTHTRDMVPVAIYDSTDVENADSVQVYDEDSVKDGALSELVGCNLLNILLDNE
ncbi:MAG: cofactor-independent phosphoglycerate mutase [archaeon]|nr:cofactor-independent phosphoglycerate mutase [archaeon]